MTELRPPRSLPRDESRGNCAALVMPAGEAPAPGEAFAEHNPGEPISFAEAERRERVPPVTVDAQLLARNKLASPLRVVEQALAQTRTDEMDATMSSAELDRDGSLRDRISDLEAVNQKLTLERDTALIEAQRLQRDLSATQDALADAARR